VRKSAPPSKKAGRKAGHSTCDIYRHPAGSLLRSSIRAFASAGVSFRMSRRIRSRGDGALRKSGIDFIHRGLELDPVQVQWAIEGLRRMSQSRSREPSHWGGMVGAAKGQKQACNTSLKYGTRDPLAHPPRRDRHDLAVRVWGSGLYISCASSTNNGSHAEGSHAGNNGPPP
jgi:hypothetical protein